MFDHIIVPLDGSPLAESALPDALALADATGASVTLLQVVPPSHQMLDYNLRYDAAAESEQLDRAGDALEVRARSLSSPGRCVRSYVTVGDAAEEIVRYAERVGGQCIVMATHGWGGVLHWAFGSVARKVLTTARVPTLVIRPQGVPEHPDRPATIRTILVPQDGSERAEAAIPVARELAQKLHARLTLARIVPVLTEMFVGSPYTPLMRSTYTDEAMGAARTAARAHLDVLARGLRSDGIAVETIVNDGSPVDRLLNLLNEQPRDLVVMSTHGRTGISRWVMGSVAERLVEASHTPVFIVRAGDAVAGDQKA